MLNDPNSSSPGDILTYCIDLATETEIGVHYELGDWTSANVPNLDYVTYILKEKTNSRPTCCCSQGPAG